MAMKIPDPTEPPTHPPDVLAASPLAAALADAIKRWDDEGDDDMTYQECLMEDWHLCEFLALALVRDGWAFTPPES